MDTLTHLRKIIIDQDISNYVPNFLIPKINKVERKQRTNERKRTDADVEAVRDRLVPVPQELRANYGRATLLPPPPPPRVRRRCCPSSSFFFFCFTDSGAFLHCGQLGRREQQVTLFVCWGCCCSIDYVRWT